MFIRYICYMGILLLLTNYDFPKPYFLVNLKLIQRHELVLLQIKGTTKASSWYQTTNNGKVYIYYPLERYWDESRIFIGGGGGRKRLCARKHEPEARSTFLLTAGVQGPGRSRVFDAMLSRAISA